MPWPKLKLIWQRYWLLISIVAISVISILIPIWYLSDMEESIRRYILAFSFASMPFGLFNTMVFVFFLYLLQFGGGFARLAKSKVKSDKVKTRFADVIGLSEAKREAWEVVQLIKDRAKLRQMGGRIVRGMILMGPPGCGKTLLAKAIATEAGIPFLSVAGSEFVEVFVGVGAGRVRSLFKQARQYAEAYGGCIIFIDELEVLAKKRTQYDAFGGSSESNSTLNQLLVEMDGLTDSEAHVMIMGAMNMPEEVLDPAVLRPGRFDRKIQISKPNLQEREEIFRYYAKSIKMDPTIDYGRLARKAVQKTPADIENILKEGALIATRNKKEQVGHKEISEAIERIELGIAHRLTMTEREREMTAYHESGHLIVLFLTHPTSDVFKASIIARGGTLGVVHTSPRAEMHSNDRNMIFADIKSYLAGYVAEKFKYGVTTSGVSSDFTAAMQLAQQMVWRFGMGTNGFVGDFTSLPKEQISDSLKEKLNAETQQILKSAMTEVEKILKAEWRILERFVGELLRREELDFDEIVEVFAEYGKKPPKLITKATPPSPPPASGSPQAAVRPPFAPPDTPDKPKSSQ